ncbi:T-cell surface antigen CD2-like isoform X1 [Melanotaenia boesemani]|uniref:T-cell surface antigen CD2-like isoform X1 n=1 Tax=Melanotaenia boesemani TaxID=1250792 RepID=UPI001C058EB3|nr:T-cell surface antigen CD2-like isoform X1 [Melanotaenia boesemani]
MKTIYMIYAALAATSLANGPFQCIFLRSAEIHQCFGAVGQPLIFYLSNKTNVDIRLLKDGKHRILKMEKNGKVIIEEEHANDYEIIYNGAYKISNASKRHAGDYMLEEYGSDGKILRKVIVHLKIQAPVSKPAVSQTCLSHELMEITCSTKGDEAELILTLDDKSVVQTRDHSQSRINCTAKECSVANVSIDLYGQLAGKIMCQVQNNVSKDETVIYLAPCKGLHAVKVAVIAGVATLYLFAALGLVLLEVCKKPRPTTVNEGNGENKIIYSNVW